MDIRREVVPVDSPEVSLEGSKVIEDTGSRDERICDVDVTQRFTMSQDPDEEPQDRGVEVAASADVDMAAETPDPSEPGLPEAEPGLPEAEPPEPEAQAADSEGDGQGEDSGGDPDEEPSDQASEEESPAEEPAEGAPAADASAEGAERPAPASKERPLPDVPAIEGIDSLARVLLALLLSAKEGVTLFRLAQSCDVTQKAVAEGLDHLEGMLQTGEWPLELARSGESVRLLSAPSAFPYLQRLRGVKRTERLSQAALETLAVIAYRQPVIRAEIEGIRGVKAGPILRTLLDHKLITVTGRADVPGRPLQYGTTQTFLERFGLSSLKDLPSIKEWKQLS